MRKRELYYAIQKSLKKSGLRYHWLYKSFHHLYEQNKLSHFQIFDMHWFKGAQEIVDYVDELHTKMTSKQDFLKMADLLALKVAPYHSKKKIAEQVKAHTRWRSASFQLEAMNKREKRQQELEPLFHQLLQYGYAAKQLPEQINGDTWEVKVEETNGEHTFLLLIREMDAILLLAADQQEIGKIEGMNHLFWTRFQDIS
jgi:hypothetical protein